MRFEKWQALGNDYVIVEADQSSVATPADVEKRVAAAKANGLKVVTLLIYRQGDFQWVAVRIDQG